MHTGSVSASVSVYSNNNTPGGGEGGGGRGGSIKHKNSKSLDFKLACQQFAVNID